VSDGLVRFLAIASKLKILRRAGWVRCGVEPCESVAEHTFGVALLALIVPEDVNTDRKRCIAMALVHDLAEAIVGDLTPHDGVPAEEKRVRERAAILEMAAELGPASELAGLGGGALVELWEEFEAGASEEARLVRDLDVIEMALQARTYQQEGRLSATNAADFIRSAETRVRTDIGRQLLQRIIADSPASG
jgi:putative hydrolase of HD superfamily